MVELLKALVELIKLIFSGTSVKDRRKAAARVGASLRSFDSVWLALVVATAVEVTATTLLSPGWGTWLNHRFLIPAVTVALCLFRPATWTSAFVAVILLHGAGIAVYHAVVGETPAYAVAMMVILVAANLAYCAVVLGAKHRLSNQTH